MSDLVSRSELIKRLKDLRIDNICINEKSIVDIIKEQPTAYNVDKVMEELNEQWNDVSCIDDDMYCIGVANGLAKAIDIVKRGGVE